MRLTRWLSRLVDPSGPTGPYTTSWDSTATAELLGDSEAHTALIRRFLRETIKDDQDREEVVSFLARVVVSLGGAFTASQLLSNPGLGTALRTLLDDPVFTSSALRHVAATLLYSELSLPDWTHQLKALAEAHSDHIMLVDLARNLAFARYLSPKTSQRDAAELRTLIGDLISETQPKSLSASEKNALRQALLSDLDKRRIAGQMSDPQADTFMLMMQMEDDDLQGSARESDEISAGPAGSHGIPPAN